MPLTPLSRIVRAVAGAAARRPRSFVALWLVLVAGCILAGSMTATRSLSGADAGVGESQRADRQIHAAGLASPAVENVLVSSPTPGQTRATAAALVARLRDVDDVRAVHGPSDSPALERPGGRTALVQATLRGDADDAGEHVAAVIAAVAATGRAHPEATLHQIGLGTINKAFDDVFASDFRRAELYSVPVTLVILLLAFGAFVAACVPLLLGLTSVAAALGSLSIVSILTPMDDSASALLVLIGLAVGVDYSLFYIRREREERAAGRSADAALTAASATVGRAIVVAGATVVVALTGLLLTGMAVFESIALATILVVVIAVAGSLTVLPAMLKLLGDHINRGRIPLIGRLTQRSAGRGVWERTAGAVTHRPVVSLVCAVSALGCIAVPALNMHARDSGAQDLPGDLPVMQALDAVDAAFPGTPDSAQIAVRGTHLEHQRAALAAFGQRASTAIGTRGRVGVEVARDGGTAVIDIPMPTPDSPEAARAVDELRSDVLPTVTQIQPAASALLTGDAAGSLDFSRRLHDMTPIVIGIVLLLALGLLVATFRSLWLACGVIALNLLSVGAAYGILVAVFQNHWAEGLLGFQSTGGVANWLPLFSFVILFGLSMDYTILVLERVREARAAGMDARAAAAEGVTRTAGSITSAALVMVGVFAIFATLRVLSMKQLGVGLATAVLLDATIVRAVALPAMLTLMGERRWRVAGQRWDDQPRVASTV